MAQLGAPNEFLTGLCQQPPERILAFGAENIGNMLAVSLRMTREHQAQQSTLQIQPFDPTAPIRDGLDPVTGRDIGIQPVIEEPG